MLDTLLAVGWMAMLIASQQTMSWIGIWRASDFICICYEALSYTDD